MLCVNFNVRLKVFSILCMKGEVKGPSKAFLKGQILALKKSFIINPLPPLLRNSVTIVFFNPPLLFKFNEFFIQSFLIHILSEAILDSRSTLSTTLSQNQVAQSPSLATPPCSVGFKNLPTIL